MLTITRAAFSMTRKAGVFWSWQCPQRVLGSQQLQHIPIEIYDEIFFWLRPTVQPNMDDDTHHKILARLATICRYFTYYCVREIARTLDFDGSGRSPHPKTPTAHWCVGIIKQQDPMYALRLDVRECIIHDWVNVSASSEHDRGLYLVCKAFLSKFPSVVSKLVNLTSLTLKKMPISLELLYSAGSLQFLQNLNVIECFMDRHTGKPPSTVQQLFPNLLDLYIAQTSPHMIEERFNIAFRRMMATHTLKSLALADSIWIKGMLTDVSLNLISFTANISSIGLQTLTNFLKVHTTIREINIYRQTYDPLINWPCYSQSYSTKTRPCDYGEGLQLDPWDLPHLEAFSGPEELAADFLSTRHISKLAMPSHLSVLDTCSSRTASFYLTGFPSKYKATEVTSDSLISTESTLWQKIGNSGASVMGLALVLKALVPGTLIALHFPNIVRLEIAVVLMDSEDANIEDDSLSLLLGLEKALNGLHHLNHLVFRAGKRLDRLTYETSQKKQLCAIKLWHAACPTLRTVVFGPYMVWHLGRGSRLYEFEDLSPLNGHRGEQSCEN